MSAKLTPIAGVREMNSKNRHRRSVLKAATLVVTSLAIYAGYLLLRRHGIGVHELLATNGNPHSITVVSILAYSLVFGVGSIAGMVIMSCMVGLPTRLMAARFLKLSLAVRALAGLFSLGFGIWLLREFLAA